jgi:hypothetical protein
MYVVIRSLGLALIILALHLIAQAAIIKNKPDLMKTLKSVSYGSLIGGIVLVLLAIPYLLRGLPPWDLISAGIILIFAVSIPILIEITRLNTASSGEQTGLRESPEAQLKLAKVWNNWATALLVIGIIFLAGWIIIELVMAYTV